MNTRKLFTMPWVGIACIAVVALLLQAIYLIRMWAIAGNWGLPVDDAWIHQTYARNVAQTGMIAFNPGEPSTGDSAPLWMLLLAIGYLLPLGAPAWTWVLGSLSHLAVGWLTFGLVRRWSVAPRAMYFALAAGLLTVIEWHLVWVTLSGMETIFFTMLTLLLVYLNVRRVPGWLVGCVAGLMIATRPEGVLLFVLVLIERWRLRQVGHVLAAMMVCAVIVAPFLAYNWIVGGSLMPNTYSAKLAVSNDPLWARLGFLFAFAGALVLGPNVLLIPFFSFIPQIVRERRSDFWLPLAWVVGLVVLYTAQLPLDIHHMRYLMPTIPWVILIGVMGVVALCERNPAFACVHFPVNAMVALVLLVNGANTYAWNVQNTNAQQVKVGEWLAQNTASDARVAAGDIGAVGFFSHRKIVDLAGLVTPQVVPYLREGKSLAPFLIQQRVRYVVVFPQYHTDLVDALKLRQVYVGHLEFNTMSPGADYVVYEVPSGDQ